MTVKLWQSCQNTGSCFSVCKIILVTAFKKTIFSSQAENSHLFLVVHFFSCKLKLRLVVYFSFSNRVFEFKIVSNFYCATCIFQSTGVVNNLCKLTDIRKNLAVCEVTIIFLKGDICCINKNILCTDIHLHQCKPLVSMLTEP